MPLHAAVFLSLIINVPGYNVNPIGKNNSNSAFRLKKPHIIVSFIQWLFKADGFLFEQKPKPKNKSAVFSLKNSGFKIIYKKTACWQK